MNVTLCARPTLSASNLQAGLASHPDRNFADTLVHACTNGVDIGYTGPRSLRLSSNWPSAHQYSSAVEDSLAKDIRLGRKLGPFSHPPCSNFVGSPMGAFPKKRSPNKFRVIHDLSWPPGSSINEFISSELFSLHYMSVDDVTNALSKLGSNAYIAKLDLSDAFHHIMVRPEDWELLGSTWINNMNGQTEYYVSTVLPFGLRSSPKLFNDFAVAAEYIMCDSGATYVNHYLDDFVTVGPPHSQECANNLSIMKSVCADLNFAVNPDKVVEACTQLEFLGIWIDTEMMELRISDDRLADTMAELSLWAHRRRAKKRALLSLIGKLSFVCRVVRSGRTFLRRMIESAKKARHLHHYVRLDAGFHADVQWWIRFLPTWNGISIFYDVDWSSSVDIELYTDASNTALAGYFQGSYFVELVHDPTLTSINYRELRAVVLAAATWGHLWAAKRILFHCDNLSVVHILKSGTSRSPSLMTLVRSLMFLCAIHSFELTAVYINTRDNDVADALSRLDWYRFWRLVPDADILTTLPAPIPDGF